MRASNDGLLECLDKKIHFSVLEHGSCVANVLKMNLKITNMVCFDFDVRPSDFFAVYFFIVCINHNIIIGLGSELLKMFS